MKRLFYSLLLAGFFIVTSCEKEAKNPGDFGVKCELEVVGISTKNRGSLDMSVLRSIDTTYVRFYSTKDTLKDSSGTPVLNEKGELQITTDTIYYNGNITARFVELEKITLDPSVDTIYIDLESNSKWKAPMPSAGGKVQWYFSQLLAGGGDGQVIATVTRNKNFKRSVDAVQYILTPDSTVMYKVVFGQKGEKDQ